MKKWFIVFCLMLICCLPVFAEYKPISANMSKQYKLEMEKIINEEYPRAINNVDNHVKDAKNLRDKMLQNGFNIEDYIKLALIPDTCIPSADLDLFIRVVKVTQEKYLKTKYEPIGADDSYHLNVFIYPYFEEYKINTKKINKLDNYINKKNSIVERYIKEINKLRPLEY